MIAEEFRIAKRLSELPPYLFVEIDRKKREAAARGVDVINLGIGDPDLPTPTRSFGPSLVPLGIR